MRRTTFINKLFAVVLTFFTLAAVTTACGSDDDSSAWPSEITFGAVPAEDAGELATLYETTMSILTDEIDGLEKINFFEASEYAGLVEGLIAGRVDAAQFGGFSYVLATQTGAELDVAGVLVDDPNAVPGYRSYLVTQPGSDINGIDDLRGKKVCFVDPGSTSGFLFPSEGLLSAGIDPSETSTDIDPIFAGGHDVAVLSVVNGDCDAGFAADVFFVNKSGGPGILVNGGDINGVIDDVGDDDQNPENADVRIIWKTEYIASPPTAINTKTLPADFIARFKEVMTTKANIDYALANGYCTGTLDDNTCSFRDDWGYIAKSDSFYDGIRKVCEVTGASKCD